GMKSASRFRLTPRILFLNAFYTAIVLALAASAISSMGLIKREVDQIASEDLPLSEGVSNLTDHQQRQTARLYEALLAACLGQDTAKAEKAFKELQTTAAEEMRETLDLFSEERIARSVTAKDNAKVKALAEDVRKLAASREEYEQHALALFAD